MNKAELLDALSAETGFTKDNCNDFLNALINIIKLELKKRNSVRLIGFGTFMVATRKKKRGRNPRTGNPMVIEPCVTAKFKPSLKLKDYIS